MSDLIQTTVPGIYSKHNFLGFSDRIRHQHYIRLQQNTKMTMLQSSQDGRKKNKTSDTSKDASKDASEEYACAESSGHFDILDESFHESNTILRLECIPNNLNRKDFGSKAAELCQQEVELTKKTASAFFCNLEKRDCLALFGFNEIKISKQILGQGEFSDVYEVIAFNPKASHKVSNLSSNEKKARKFLATHSKREKSKEKRYAIKHLRPQYMENPEKFIIAARDLAFEAQLLACIDHPNIIKIRGHTIDGPDGYESGLNTGYFLILDRLQGTLYDRIISWKKRQKKSVRILNKLLHYKGHKEEKSWADRLKACFDLAGALFYLHEHGIIYRDLKPQNIGFDIRGDVKLFDFGLAKFLPPDARSVDETYTLSGAGSLRYMAPEVAKGDNYNLKADVYGFALVCWAALKIDIPFQAYNGRMIFDGVVNGGADGDRPQLQAEWPNEIQRMLEKGWSNDPRERPTMKSCCKTLRGVLGELGYDDLFLDHAKRRSSFMIHSERRVLPSVRHMFKSFANISDDEPDDHLGATVNVEGAPDRRSLMATLKRRSTT